jgi:hypothetical protein
MERIRGFWRFPAKGAWGHAPEGGTILRVGNPDAVVSIGVSGEVGGEFEAADFLENAFRKSARKRLRQGIANRCRHVAPALLLC